MQAASLTSFGTRAQKRWTLEAGRRSLGLTGWCVSSATKPHPAVDEPERNSNGVHDHLPLGSLLVLLLQELQPPVQFDDLHRDVRERSQLSQEQSTNTAHTDQ